MQILLTAHQFFPKYFYGTELHTFETACELQLRGHHVEVLTVEPSTREEMAAQPEVDDAYLGVPVHRIRRCLREQFPFEYHNAAVLEQVRLFLRQRAFDVAHLFHCDRFGAGLIGLLKEFEIPVVFSAMDFWFLCPLSQLLRHDGSLCGGPPEDGVGCIRCTSAKVEPPAAWARIERSPDAALRRYAAFCRTPLGRLGRRSAWVRNLLGRAAFLREQLNQADHVFVMTDLMRDLLVANGIRAEIIELSPFGIDPLSTRGYYALPDVTFEGARRLYARREKAPSSSLRFAYLGQLQPHKGVHLAVEAFCRLAPRRGATLTIYGDDDPYAPYVRELRARAAAAAAVALAGKYERAQLTAVLAGVDVLLAPSLWYENTPLVVREALDCGTPVIAADVGGLSQQVRHERNGLLFPVGDREGLRQAMQRLIDEEGLWQRLRDGIEPVRSLVDEVDHFLAVYDRLYAGKLWERFDAPLPAARVELRRA